MTTANVLVVDDDPEMCRLVSTILHPSDIQVESALDGYQGIEKAQQRDPDLIVLDVMMPGMDGWEAYQRIKDVTNAPIMFLTVLSDDASRERGRELGAVDFLPKPFGAREFLEIVKRLIRESTHPTRTLSPSGT
jgi:DNA-binding response OmpR family regulator